MTNQAIGVDTAHAVTATSENWGMLSHISSFVMFLGIPAFVGPLVVWLLKRDDPYVDFHGKEALNFNISFMIYGLVAAFLVVVLIGLLALPIVLVTWFVLTIVASLKAASGEYYRYPFTLRLIS